MIFLLIKTRMQTIISGLLRLYVARLIPVAHPNLWR